MTARRPPRPRDPEGRREAILDAALEVIAERGIDNTTHRLIAERADVPLGSTTYYFPSLTDLIAAALDKGIRDCAAEVARWSENLDAVSGATTLTRHAAVYLESRARAIVETEVYLAAAREDSLRPLARVWLEGLQSRLEPITGKVRARAIAMLLDGAMIQALALNLPLDAESLESGLAALIEPGESETRSK